MTRTTDPWSLRCFGSTSASLILMLGALLSSCSSSEPPSEQANGSAAPQSECDDGATPGYFAKATHDRLRRGAEDGDKQDTYNLAVSFARGDGVCQSYSEALRWYEEAAKLGHGSGLYQYGRMLFEGEGTEKHRGRGAAYLILAADRNNGSACQYVEEEYEELRSFFSDPTVTRYQEEWSESYVLPSMILFPTCDDL